MFLREWFRPPRHLLALFVAVIVLPAIALAWLAWRTFQQDKALERQRVQERLETAASSVIAGLDRRLDELARQIPILAASANVSLPDDFLLVTIRDGTITLSPPGRALYYPRVPEGRRARDAGLASAEALEFREQNSRSAADVFRRLARSGDPAVKAAALLGLARCLRKSGQDQDALAAYDDLARLGTFLVEGVPADLVARHARCALLAHMNAPELTPQAAALYGDLQQRRWILDRASYAFYSGEVRAWLPPAAAPPADPLVLALTDAVGDVDRLRHETGVLPGQGRQAAWLHDRPLLIVWANTPREMVALVAGPSWFAQTASLSKTLNVALALVDGQSHVVAGAPERLAGPVVVRQPADSGLPWTLRIASADPARELALLSGHRRLALAGLVLLGILILTGGYLVERALARELAAARLQADFVATVSHEFRSPLTSMKHLLEMLEQGAVKSEDRRHRYYQVLSGETERLRRLVENLLNFRRMEAGKVEFRFEPVDAVDLVERVAADFRAQLASSDRLVVSADAHGVRVGADREAMSRALWNLIDNAAKYSPESAPIHLDLAADDRHVRISVRDHGPGIPPAERKQIFKRFYRGADTMKSGVKGTGIGLATVHLIVRAHHGEIHLDTTPENGCTFTIVLPALPPARETPPETMGSNGGDGARHG
jgi:signal transduction histidine kinase